jgi:hypothetical protein
MDIYGYIHICQIGYWRKSLSLLLDALFTSGLYESSTKIYLCVVSNAIQKIDTSFDTLNKCEVMYIGNPEEFERPTLKTVKSFSCASKKEELVWYMHTKGITHFDTKKEQTVLDWIQLLLYWNVHQWKIAVEQLQDPNIYMYGCNLIGPHKIYTLHFSGNFWWSKTSWIATLPYSIGPNHTDPEFWITNHSMDTDLKKHIYCPFQSDTYFPLESSSLHYDRPFPKLLYEKRTQKMNLHGFIHVANNGPQRDWIHDVRIIFTDLVSSKLLDEFKTLTIVGGAKLKTELQEFTYVLEKPNVTIVEVNTSYTPNTESHCLQLLRTRAKFDADESLYWYAHTLNESVWEKKECKDDLLLLQLYFTCKLWKQIVQDIMIRPHQKNQVYGCNLYYTSVKENAFFDGNFWWAKTSHLKKLDDCGPTSIDAREWVLQKECEVFNIFSSGINHVKETFPRKKYCTLSDLNNEETDKNTVHSYLETYTNLLCNRRVEKILEVGVKNGGSIQLWHDYFEKALIYGIDTNEIVDKTFPALPNPRLRMIMNTDAYCKSTVDKFAHANEKFDVLIDDGPHTLESMKDFLLLYLTLLQPTGVLIIEDLQDISWHEILVQSVPESMRLCCSVYDFRLHKNRYDDIMFVLDLNLQKEIS